MMRLLVLKKKTDIEIPRLKKYNKSLVQNLCDYSKANRDRYIDQLGWDTIFRNGRVPKPLHSIGKVVDE